METRRRKRIRLESECQRVISSSTSNQSQSPIPPKKLKKRAPRLTKKEKESMNNALQNPLIVDIILKNLDFPELKVCRRINHTWNDLATKLVLKKDSSIIRLQYYRKTQMYYKSSKKGILDEDHDLVELEQILEKSKNFPCTHFSFRDVLKLGAAEIKRFFQLHGVTIKTLEFYGYEEITSFEDMEQDNYEFLLPSLKSFTWEYSAASALKIFKCAPNLDNIPWVIRNRNNINLMRITGTTGLVKQIISPLVVLSYNKNNALYN